jgi:FtsH-binding integral membrane protein
MLTSLICGLALVAAVDFRNEVVSFRKASVLLTVFIVCALPVTVLKYSSSSKSFLFLFILRIALLTAVLITLNYKKLNTDTNKMRIWWFIILTGLTLSEIISRYIFFLLFEKSGL